MKIFKLIGILFGISVVAIVMPVLLLVLIPIGFICWDSILISVSAIYDYIKNH